VGDHLARLAKERGAIASSRTIEESLRRLHDAGILLARSDVFAAAYRASYPSPPKITTIVWPTRNRNKSLKRSIEEYIANNRKYERTARYLVVDNSIDLKDSRECKQILTNIISSQDIPIHYCGIEEKQRFIDAMIQKGKEEAIPRWLMQFALIGDSDNSMRYGVARNTTLLATSGEMILTTDDDTHCSFAEALAHKPGLALSSEFDPNDVRFFANRETLLESISIKELDILAEHESLLGRCISDCLPVLESEHQINEQEIFTGRMSPRFASLLNRGKGRVALTLSGVCGDSAMSSARLVLQLEGRAREMVLETKETYDLALSIKEIVRAVERKTISDGAFFMTVNAAIDNRELLPPFFTSGRNEEGIFALILRICFEDALIGHLPTYVYHDPMETRRLQPEGVRRFEPQIEHLVTLLIETYKPSVESATPIQKLQDLGYHFKEIGHLPLEEFTDYIRIRWMAYLSSLINSLESQLSRHASKPDYWARDIEALQESARDFVKGRRTIVSVESRDEATNESENIRIQQHIGQFGELIIRWPSIVALSRKMREEGNGLAVCL
jgi:hypothetical protein